jgi:stage V sporulation protein R
MVWEYYVKSRKAQDYRAMLLDALYHPPNIQIDGQKNEKNTLYLVHHFEGKPLVAEFIRNTMMGIEYLWGAPVALETSEIKTPPQSQGPMFNTGQPERKKEIKWQRVLYTMENRKLSKSVLE